MGRRFSKTQVVRRKVACEEPALGGYANALGTPDNATGDYSVHQGTGQLFETKNVVGKRQPALALFSLATIELSRVRFLFRVG